MINAIEVTISDFDLLKKDGIVCSVGNETVFPIPITYLCGNAVSRRDINCYYSSIPILDGYKDLVGSSMEVKMEYKENSILINEVENIFNNENGCKAVTPTEAPTEAPDNSRKM